MITDEQIRELARDGADVEDVHQALFHRHDELGRAARARLAELWNARTREMPR